MKRLPRMVARLAGRVQRLCIAGLAALVLAGCAAVVQSMLINAAPDYLASMFGQYETRAEFKQAAPLIQQKDWLGLTILARQKLDLQPQRAEWWQLAGYGHLELGELKVARDCFERVTRLMPEEVGGWNLLAYTLKKMGDANGARVAVEHAIQTDPSSGTAFVILGELHREGGRSQLALQAYKRAIEINRTDVYAWYGLGLLGKRGRDGDLYERAKSNLQQLNPAMAEQLEKA